MISKESTWPKGMMLIIMRSNLLSEERLHELLAENDQLCRIISASIQTARVNAGR